MQLDTEEGESFVPPAGIVAAAKAENDTPDKAHANNSDLGEAEARNDADSETQD